MVVNFIVVEQVYFTPLSYFEILHFLSSLYEKVNII